MMNIPYNFQHYLLHHWAGAINTPIISESALGIKCWSLDNLIFDDAGGGGGGYANTNRMCSSWTILITKCFNIISKF